ncbi:MAG: DUF814 domain-containing protein [Deltaproteobacteria bacterium]|nr:DUF814 domain-containing protein [Deltaproteobacteria bacterium]
MGIPLKVFNVSEEYLDVVRHPKHGYGRNMNPCIDCRIFMLKKTRAYMEESGAEFIVTGEVLGQRPMSQRRDAMRMIEKEAGLEGLILRPLSAQYLPITLPEREGWIDRNKLLNIQGRSRKPQIKLAEQYSIRDYPCAAGGCLLTDPGFGHRMKDLMDHGLDFSLNDVHLLKIGRHFRLSPEVKLVVGRNEEENQKIETFSREGDILLKTAHHPGPVSLLRGRDVGGELARAASITARYSKAKGVREVEVHCQNVDGNDEKAMMASSISEREVERFMIFE